MSASDGAIEDHFGNSVVIDGADVIVGTQDDDDRRDGSGSVYLFKDNGNGILTKMVKILVRKVVG